MKKHKRSLDELLVEAIISREEQPYEIPENWIWTKINFIGEVKGGKRLPKGHSFLDEKTPYPYLRVTDFNNGTIDGTKLKYVSEQTASKISSYTIKEEDIYISIAGTIGKTGSIPNYLDGALLTENAAKITNLTGISKLYLELLFNSEELQNQIRNSTVHTSQPKLAITRIKEFVVPLPSINEQKRIAEKVKLLLTKIEEAQQLIEEAKDSFELRRAAILDKAFSGELGNDNTSKKTRKINDQVTLEIPEHWEIFSLGEVVENFNNKRIPVSQKKREEIKGNIPYYGATGIVDYVDGFTHEGEFVLIGEDGANLLSRAKPQAFIINGKSWVNNHAHVVRMKDKMSNNFLKHYINHIPLNSYVTGTAQPKLNRTKLDSISIVIPPIKEQNEIALKVDFLLEKEAAIFKTCEITLISLINLEQTILNKAFRGALGTNDPTEENAIELLIEVLQEKVK